MCLIAVKKQGSELPDKNRLQIGYNNNSDGAGIALLKAGKNHIHIKKDFADFDSFYTWITLNVDKQDLLVIHFRMATSGITDAGNRHPFVITHNKHLLRQTDIKCRYAVAHNGVISEYSKGNTKYSDTQKFILDILAPVKHKLCNPAVQKLIKNYIGGDKLAIIDAVQKQLILIGEYTELDGILYSNNSYAFDKTLYIKNYRYGSGKPECDLCGNVHKVKYDKITKTWLCKKCRKGISKHGLYSWLDEVYKNAEDEDDEISAEELAKIEEQKYNYYEKCDLCGRQSTEIYYEKNGKCVCETCHIIDKHISTQKQDYNMFVTCVKCGVEKNKWNGKATSEGWTCYKCAEYKVNSGKKI